MSHTRAYNELVNILLAREDRVKFEWAIGAMLSDGPRNIVVVRGPAGSGKTTLMTIVRKVLLSPFTGHFAPRVDFLNEDNFVEVDPDAFTFAEINHISGLELDAIVIETTGNRVPVNKHYVLMREIDSELIDIANSCISLYREMGDGDDCYSTFEENNR